MTDRLPHPAGRASPMSWIALGLLGLFTGTAIAGYWVFALHPNLIPDSEFARTMYGISFKLFARVQIVLSGLVLAWFLVTHSRFRWLPAFGAVALASFLSEHIGTGYGFPFSGYEYTALLGWKLGGRVPLVIPVSWFLMALPSWVLARSLFSSLEQRIPRVLLAAYLLTTWDLALDPAMSYLTPYWVWESSGPYYGMPWVNLAGWMGTGIVLMILLELLGAERWTARLDIRWIGSYYAVVLLMPLGMLAAAGLWTGVVTTLAALLLGWSASAAFLGFLRRRRVLPILQRQVTP